MKSKAIIVLVISIMGLLGTDCLAAKKSAKSTGPVAQSSLSGIILDKNSNEKLTGVTVQLTSTDQKIYSDSKGEFNLERLTPGTYKVKINCISYKEQEVTVAISKDRNQKLRILLNPIEP